MHYWKEVLRGTSFRKLSKWSSSWIRDWSLIYLLFFLICSSIVSNFFFCSAGTNLGHARSALPTNLNCDEAMNCFSSSGVFSSAALPPCFWKTVNTSAAILTRTAFTNSTSSDLASQKVTTDIEEYVSNSLLVTGDVALDCATAVGANDAPPRRTDAWREAAESQKNAFEFNWLIDLRQSLPTEVVERWCMVQVDEPDMEKQRRWKRRTQSTHQMIPLNNAQAKRKSIQLKTINLEAKLALNQYLIYQNIR